MLPQMVTGRQGGDGTLWTVAGRAKDGRIPLDGVDGDGVYSMVRMVQCVKLGRELPGLEKPPFPGPLGERIYEHISAEAYAGWLPHMTILINHYALNPADPETRQLLRREMEGFFFGVPEGDATQTEGLTPPTA